jgi:hypothetical protein
MGGVLAAAREMSCPPERPWLNACPDTATAIDSIATIASGFFINLAPIWTE